MSIFLVVLIVGGVVFSVDYWIRMKKKAKLIGDIVFDRDKLN